MEIRAENRKWRGRFQRASRFVFIFLIAIYLFPLTAHAGNVVPLNPLNPSNPKDVPDTQSPAKPLEKEMDLEGMKENFFLFGNVTAYGSYSKTLGSTSLWGGKGNGFLAPAYKINDKTFFIFLMNGFYNRTKTTYKEDKGSRLVTESLSYTITPTIKYSISDDWSISPTLFYTRFLSRQNSSVKWGTDLYDYKEFGGGILLGKTIKETKRVQRDLSLTVQYYERKYPNYISLLTITGLGSVEEREKDYNAILLSTTYNSRNTEGLSYSMNLSALHKMFIDKRIENANGGRDSGGQLDTLYTLSSQFEYKKSDRFTYLFDTSLNYNVSNQNLSSGTFPANTFNKDYYSYYSVTLRPGIKYTHQLSNGKDLILKASYGVTLQHYIGRLAKSAEGDILNKRQQDFTHEYAADATYKWDKHWDILGAVSLQRADSNYRDESTYRYTYDLLTISAGISYNF